MQASTRRTWTVTTLTDCRARFLHPVIHDAIAMAVSSRSEIMPWRRTPHMFGLWALFHEDCARGLTRPIPVPALLLRFGLRHMSLARSSGRQFSWASTWVQQAMQGPWRPTLWAFVRFALDGRSCMIDFLLIPVHLPAGLRGVLDGFLACLDFATFSSCVLKKNCQELGSRKAQLC